MLDNKRSKENVKEVTLYSKIFVPLNSVPRFGYYLIISPTSVSARTRSYQNGMCTAPWSYHSETIAFHHSYERLLEEVFSLFSSEEKPALENRMTDINIRINYKDGTSEERYLMGNLIENGYNKLAKAARWFFQRGEGTQLPALYSCPWSFYNLPLTKERMEKMDKKSVCAIFFYVDSDDLDILTDQLITYSTGHKDEFEEGIVHQHEAMRFLFGEYPPFPTCLFNNMANVEVFGENWVYVYLGMGNHLYMRREFYEEHIAEIIDPNPMGAFAKWCKLARLG